MAFERLDTKKLVFAGVTVVLLGLGAAVWYPRLFPAKRPLRVQQPPPPVIRIESPRPSVAVARPARQEPPPRRETPAPTADRVAPDVRSPATVAAVKAVAPLSRPAQPNRPRSYGLQFPPFVTAAEASELERRLKEAGLPTFTTTQDGSMLYALVVGPFPDPGKAQEAHAALGGKLAPAADAGQVLNDGPYVLREVVRRGVEIRKKGYEVKIVSEGEGLLYVLRTAARLDVAQATELSRHYRKLGFPNSVVQAR